jgi:hypothetical protein
MMSSRKLNTCTVQARWTQVRRRLEDRERGEAEP